MGKGESPTSDAWPEAVCIAITHDNRKTANQGRQGKRDRGWKLISADRSERKNATTVSRQRRRGMTDGPTERLNRRGGTAAPPVRIGEVLGALYVSKSARLFRTPLVNADQNL